MIAIQSFIDNYLLDLTKRIGDILDKSLLILEIIGPTFRNRTNNVTVSYNITPEKKDLLECWRILNSILKTSFKELSKSGEVIIYSIEEGGIFDQGIEYFKVLKATIFESYVYEPESFIYTRLLHEFDMVKKNEWLSIDIDAISQSAWFEE